MTDLILQDLNNLTSEGLAQILSKEKREILGEQRVPAKNEGSQPFILKLICRFSY